MVERIMAKETMRKQIVIIISIIVLIAAITVLWKGSSVKRDGQASGKITNEEMLDNENSTEIIIEDNVQYYKEAKGYFVRPRAEGNYPGVVMIHENRGLRPEIKATAEQLAKEGYAVLAVDLLGRVVETQDEARVLTTNFIQKDGTENLQAAVQYLKNKGANKIASLGWCFGGGQSLSLALSGTPLDATVIYYGRLATTTKELSVIKWPVLGIFAGNDQVISTSSVEQFKNALDILKTKNEIYIYPGVGHAFANPSGMNYAPNETRDAWTKTLNFLKANL